MNDLLRTGIQTQILSPLFLNRAVQALAGSQTAYEGADLVLKTLKNSLWNAQAVAEMVEG